MNVTLWTPAKEKRDVTIHLPEDLEKSIRSLVEGGRYASEDDVITEAVRTFLRRPEPSRPNAGLGSIGAMRDAADELDEIVDDAMRRRREETWRVIPGE